MIEDHKMQLHQAIDYIENRMNVMRKAMKHNEKEDNEGAYTYAKGAFDVCNDILSYIRTATPRKGL